MASLFTYPIIAHLIDVNFLLSLSFISWRLMGGLFIFSNKKLKWAGPDFRVCQPTLPSMYKGRLRAYNVLKATGFCSTGTAGGEGHWSVDVEAWGLSCLEWGWVFRQKLEPVWNGARFHLWMEAQAPWQAALVSGYFWPPEIESTDLKQLNMWSNQGSRFFSSFRSVILGTGFFRRLVTLIGRILQSQWREKQAPCSWVSSGRNKTLSKHRLYVLLFRLVGPT